MVSPLHLHRKHCLRKPCRRERGALQQEQRGFDSLSFVRRWSYGAMEPWRIHGAGILMLTKRGVFVDGIHVTKGIAAPWILWVGHIKKWVRSRELKPSAKRVSHDGSVDCLVVVKNCESWYFLIFHRFHSWRCHLNSLNRFWLPELHQVESRQAAEASDAGAVQLRSRYA